MKELPIGIQDFETLRGEELLYVNNIVNALYEIRQ